MSEETITYYICKYTPVELLCGYGATCAVINSMPDSTEDADRISHPNLCGFGKALLENVRRLQVRELVLVNCCDTIRSVYDVLLESGACRFLYLIDLPHDGSACARDMLVRSLRDLAHRYSAYRGTSFDRARFLAAFPGGRQRPDEPYLSVMGGRMGDELFDFTRRLMPLEVSNDTCVSNRALPRPDSIPDDFDALLDWYAGVLLGQIPCMRMFDVTGRRALLEDPNLRGIIYHTVKFCDYYGFEYSSLRKNCPVPLLKIESDFTLQSRGQLRTRLEAFAESILPSVPEKRKEKHVKSGYFAGIDSGSTSTDVVLLDADRNIAAAVILPTGAGAAAGAERALEQALDAAGLTKDSLVEVVTTGYGREAIQVGDHSVTEISCHAKGAFFLDPEVRTIIDIGGQDSKVIRIDETGRVVNFVMNDKCAAGTGRFLELMARTLEMSLEEMSRAGLSWKEDITISSMCTVFAESEVVSLIAENKATSDIVHGLCRSVASKTSSLVRRVDGVPKYMMTGGVAKNQGVVRALEESLQSPLEISPYAQVCGALGAALFALESL